MHTQDGPCGTGTLRSADERIASGRSGYADGLLGRPTYPSDYVYDSDAEQRSLFVVVGVGVGSTTLELATERGEVGLDVTVVE
jgi:hypothetical protein